jgi:hypothetical protein
VKSKDFKFEKCFFIAINDYDNIPIIFTSDNYHIGELDYLRLIKMCYIEGRNKHLGERLISIYKESVSDSENKLKAMGISQDETKKTKKYRKR